MLPRQLPRHTLSLALLDGKSVTVNVPEVVGPNSAKTSEGALGLGVQFHATPRNIYSSALVVC